MTSRSFFPLGVALSLLGAACGGSVVGGGGTGGEGGGGSSSGTVHTGGGGAPTVVIYGDETLTLRATSFGATCADPEKSPPYGECNWFFLEINFPASLLVPGPLVDGNGISTLMSESGPPSSGSPGDCPGSVAVSGGGPGGGGLIADVTFGAIDASSAVVTLAGFNSSFIDFAVDGTYTAPRCN
jgi:hypothetical protein